MSWHQVLVLAGLASNALTIVLCVYTLRRQTRFASRMDAIRVRDAVLAGSDYERLRVKPSAILGVLEAKR